ncbi:SDR family NAD(P)-dependent oxidoreductase, partial [Streptomyces decoyicus]
MVTGATSGLGRHLVHRLADRRATVIVHGRDEGKVARTCEEVTKRGGAAIGCVADFEDLIATHDMARRLAADIPAIDVLINNAAIGPGAPGAPRKLTCQGNERCFCVGYLAPHVLTYTLLPKLSASRESRIINVGSGTHEPVDTGDLAMDTSYDGWVAYRRAKFALLSLTHDVAEQCGPHLRAVYVHPANLMPTNLVAETGIPPSSTLEEGAGAVLAHVADPQMPQTLFYTGQLPASPPQELEDPGIRSALRHAIAKCLKESSGVAIL